MNFLRSSPFKSLVLASALQVFILFCWAVPVSGADAASAAGLALRHSLINFLRSSPLSSLVLASALQVLILFC